MWREAPAPSSRHAAASGTAPNNDPYPGTGWNEQVIDGNTWVLNGKKMFCTHGSVSAFTLISAVTDPSLGPKGISTILVNTDSPGYIRHRQEKKLGLRGSDTSEIHLQNCRVPKENLIGKRGEGLKQFLETVVDTEARSEVP